MSEKKESGSGKVYTCKLCKKTFKQKCDYDKHANKKAPCISLEACEAMIVKKDEKFDSKKDLTTFFKNCLDILRDSEGLTGEKALRNLSYLLILKLLEPHFGSIIDIDNHPYDLSCFEDDVREHNKDRLLSCVRFSNLSKEDEINLPNMMKYTWDVILSEHPSTKNIFLPEKRFDIQNQKTYRKIIDKLNEINFSNMENDILGDSYEEVIQDIMTGKVLGQFFTPPSIKKFMINLINPKINDDGTIESCCDPTMGTGGFLIEYIRVIQEKARLNGITLNWDFIKNYGLYGKELEPDTYQLAVSNMLISTGHMFEKLDRGDSIREPITRKFDNILANPPFGIKGLKYDDFQSSLKLQYVPIKSDNAVSLFIQAIIYMLNIGGKCAVVLPDGQDLFSKTNKTLVAVREYLMKTCDLKEIYYLPSGIFEYTTIKTCVFYFVKKREGTDVIEVKINTSKTQKETGRDYKFSKTHQTGSVKFYDYNPYEVEGVKNLLVEVPIDKIASNSYSLNYAEYIKDDAEEEEYEDGIIVKTLGEICSIDYGTRIVKGNNIEGEYPVYGSGRAMFSTETFNRDGFNILIGRFALSLECVRFVNDKIFLNDSGLSLKPKIDGLLHKYIGYYLLHNQNIIYNCARGTAQKNLEMDIFKSIKIPIPSIELQKEIVKYLDFIYEKANKTSYEKIAELKQLNEFCLNNQRIFGDNIVKTLGEVCDIDYGTRIVKGNNVEGEYPVYGSGRAMFSTNTFNREGFNILIGRFALSSECVRLINEKIFLNDSGLTVKPKSSILLHKYIGYYLFHNQNGIYNCSRGTAQKNLEMDIFKSIKIPIPSLQRQQEIVAYCEINDTLIKQLENEIDNNKKEAQQFLKNAFKFQAQE
jgi:type I restriction-modification system DNA methylase subunit